MTSTAGSPDAALLEVRGVSKSFPGVRALQGVDFTGARFRGARLTAAHYDARTRWPAGFDPVIHGAVKER